MSKPVLSLRAITVMLVGVGMFLVGCQHVVVQQSVVSRYSADSDEAQMDFWHELNNVPIATNDDGLHAVLLYLDDKDPNPDYAARLSVLKSRQLLPADFNQTANQALERGTLAVILTHALHIKGGMMQHLLPYTPRYAVRELYYEELYPLSSPQQTFSGAELVGIIGKVEDYQRGDPSNKPATVLSEDSEEQKSPPATNSNN